MTDQTPTIAKAPQKAKRQATPTRMPGYIDELVRTVYRMEAKLDYTSEENRAALRRYDDHETRIRSLEASDSKRQGGNTTARFLYGAVWPAVSFTIAAIGMYLQYKANHP